MAVGFPVLICALIPLRTTVLPKVFTPRELKVLDDLTADNEIVLASFGGAPRLPENKVNDEHGLEHKWEEQKKGVPRQRIGDIHR